MADLALARKVLETEAAAILALVGRVDAKFEAAVELLRTCRGRVIVTGMGKSGIICRKIAATLTSTGTPAFFLHPAEATHGDLGVLQADDVVLALSYSGETDEILRLLETIRRLGAKLIVITGAPASSLAHAADVAIDGSVTEEACPMNLVPTASTTASLALGDALAMTLLVEKGFRQEDFASLHPGGKLGKRLMRVDSLMHAGAECPIVGAGTQMRDVIYEMSSKALGMTCVVDASERLVGIITDGVLTDGKILIHPDGTESKQFDIKDGTGLVWAQRAGLKVGVLSARSSAATAQRAAQLGITIVHQGVSSKLRAYDEILRQYALTDADVAYMGDDVLDLPVITRAGLSGSPADAVEDVRTRVDYVSRAGGGSGAARDFVELVLKAQDRWQRLFDHE